MRFSNLSHIYLWSGWIDKLNAPRIEARVHPHLLQEFFFKNYTYLWNHFVNFNQTLPKRSLGSKFLPLPKLCSVCLGSKEGPKRGPKMINYFNIWKYSSCEPAMPEDWYLAHNIDKSWKKESSLTKWFWLAPRLLHLRCFLDLYFLFWHLKFCFYLVFFLHYCLCLRYLYTDTNLFILLIILTYEYSIPFNYYYNWNFTIFCRDIREMLIDFIGQNFAYQIDHEIIMIQMNIYRWRLKTILKLVILEPKSYIFLMV